MKDNAKKIPPLKTLPAFLAVSQHLSFSKAANELHVTHSAISQSIRLLEEFLGVKLFNRKAKQITLTSHGEEYLRNIHPAMHQIMRATEQQMGLSDSNVLTVNVMTTLTLRWLIPRLPSFQEKHSDIDLRLSNLGRDIDFNKDHIDISTAYGYAEQWPDAYVKKLFSDRLVLVSKHDMVPKRTKLEKLLAQFKSIYVDDSLRQDDWRLWCEEAGVKEPKKSQRIYFKSSSQALQAVVSGLGVMVTHEPFIVDDICSGLLQQIDQTTLPLQKSYFLICTKEKYKLKNVSSFFRWLAKEFSED